MTIFHEMTSAQFEYLSPWVKFLQSKEVRRPQPSPFGDV